MISNYSTSWFVCLFSFKALSNKKFVGDRSGYGKLEDVIGSTPLVPRASLYTLMPLTPVKDQVNALAEGYDKFYHLRDGDGAIGEKQVARWLP